MRRFEVWNADRLVAVGVEFDTESAEGCAPAVLLPLGEPHPIVAPDGLPSVPMMFAEHTVKVFDLTVEGPAQPKRKRSRKGSASAGPGS
jgi:hypothetical protein